VRIENGELKKNSVGISASSARKSTNSPAANDPSNEQNSQFSPLNSQLISACSAAADELAASRELIDALEKENTALNARLATEKQTTAILGELNETRKTETEALRSAIAAKNEALTAKDSVISAQDKLIETLKRKRSSPWKRIGDVLVGVGIAVILK